MPSPARPPLHFSDATLPDMSLITSSHRLIDGHGFVDAIRLLTSFRLPHAAFALRYFMIYIYCWRHAAMPYCHAF